MEEDLNQILILFDEKNNLLVTQLKGFMAGKKGVVPSHVKSKQFVHPGIDHPIIHSLAEIEDPRKPSLFLRHSLPSILFMTLVAIVCGANDWPKVVVMSQGMIDWLAQYVDMSGGVPCERTFKSVFNLINPLCMEKMLRETAAQIREIVPQEIISFDGQTERGTADRQANRQGLHLVHAWSSDNGICLGQCIVDEKSNEITALPKLMESLDLKGTIITNDALNTQKTTVEKAVELGADYVMPVKGNHPLLLDEIVALFQEREKEILAARVKWERALGKAQKNLDRRREQELLKQGPSPGELASWPEELNKGHGRIERRKYAVIPAADLSHRSEWKGLQSLVRVQREREKDGKIEKTEIYYITSLQSNNQRIPEAIRNHWGVESFHWQLDVTFQQDKSRYRNRVGAQNLAVLRKIALQALSQEKSKKAGMATKQCAAACNPQYRAKIVENLISILGK